MKQVIKKKKQPNKVRKIKEEEFDWIRVQIPEGWTPHFFDLRDHTLAICIKKSKPVKMSFAFAPKH